MQYFEEEIKINIFKYVNYPLNLALTCRNWSVIVKNPYAKTEWLISHYGKKAHALFHAVRLGPTFINIPVCQALIARNVAVSRYFIQRLLMYFGKYNQKLIELKIEHQFDAGRIQQKIKLPWTNNLFIFLFTYLLNGQLTNANKVENDMMLFHFLSVGSRVIKYYVPEMLIMNLKDIEAISLNKRFSQFLHRPKPDLNSDSYTHQQPIPEEYLSKENNRLNVVKYFDSLQQESFLRPLTVLTLFTNNVGIFGAQSSRNVNRRRRLRRQRSTNRRRSVQFNAPINNQDTLDRIANLPQQFASDSLINQFFNGSLFI